MAPLLPRDFHLCVSGLNFKILLVFAFSRIHTQFSETAALTVSLVFWGFAFSAVRCWSPTSLLHPNGCPELSMEAGFLHCFPQKESQTLVFPTWTWGYFTVGSLNPSPGSPWASAGGWHFRSFLGLYRRQVFAVGIRQAGWPTGFCWLPEDITLMLLCGFWRSEPRRSGLGSLSRLPSSTGNISLRQQSWHAIPQDTPLLTKTATDCVAMMQLI